MFALHTRYKILYTVDMLYSISGTVTHKNDGRAVIETAGIGFVINCPDYVLKKLTKGKKALLRVFLHADRHELYGFLKEDDIMLFEQLISVSGVGPKGALKLMNSLSSRDLKSLIVLERADMLAKRGSVGKKTASKIVLELKDKIKGGGVDKSPVSLDVEAVLKNLGYYKDDIVYALKHIPSSAKTTETQVKAALENLAKRT